MRLLIAPATILFVAAWHDPAVFLWALGVAAVVGLGALAGAAHHFHNERDEAHENAARLSRELEAAEWALAAERDVRRRTEHAFAELQTALSDGRVVMPLRSVAPVIPIQRAATHDHLAEDDAWFERLYDDKGDLR